jgi:hypothetical protein
MIDLIGMSFIPLCTVIGPFVFFVMLLFIIWGGLRLVMTIFLRVAIMLRYCTGDVECGRWLLSGEGCFNWLYLPLTGSTK